MISSPSEMVLDLSCPNFALAFETLNDNDNKR